MHPTTFKLFSLALNLGMTVREMLERMDADEFHQWLAFYDFSPWGEERADLRAGIITAAIARVFGRSKKFDPGVYMPKFGKPKVKPAGCTDTKRMAMCWTAALGGVIETKKVTRGSDDQHPKRAS